ncbi:MAG: dihydroorotate dehydrogenase [Desulfurivibrionaceae bacterium]
MEPDLSVKIRDWPLKNPIITASGTFGYGKEFADFLDIRELGAVMAKGVSLEPRKGNPPPRIVETPCGLLNAIGLENVGVERFIEEKLPYLLDSGVQFGVNILADTLEDYAELASRLDKVDVPAVEVNISCPNVKKGGVAFGTDPVLTREVSRAVKDNFRGTVIVKLSPNVTDIKVMAGAAEEGGADAISLINTLLGMAIDHRQRKPVLANTIGGLSGPAVKPVALRMVWEAAGQVEIPVIGIGGIRSLEDVLEFLLAGASAVQVGTANLVEPGVSAGLVNQLRDYCRARDIARAADLTGVLRLQDYGPDPAETK